MQVELVSETPLNTIQVKEELEKIKKRDKEPNFRVAKTLEYLEHFVKLSPQKERELFDKITKINVPRLRDLHIHKIIDTMPLNANEAKVVLQGYNLTISNENLKKVADLVASYWQK